MLPLHPQKWTGELPSPRDFAGHRTPEQEHVLSLMTEFIRPQDGVEKKPPPPKDGLQRITISLGQGASLYWGMTGIAVNRCVKLAVTIALSF